MHFLIRGMVLLLLCCLTHVQAAETGWLQDPQNPHARINLRAQDANNMTRVLLQVQMDDGWKTYWRSPGEGGLPPEIHWDSNVSVKWNWPVPQLFEVSGLIIQGYHDSVILPLNLSGVAGSSLSGTLRLPVCSSECTIATIPFELNLNDGTSRTFDTDFAQAMRAVPAKSGLYTHLNIGYSDGVIHITAAGISEWQDPALFIDTLNGASFGKPLIKVQGHSFSADVPVTDEFGEAETDKGIQGRYVSLVIADGPLSQQGSAPVSPTADNNKILPAKAGYLHVLLLALVGGLILNLMPCVLPVLAMKLNAFTHAHSAQRRSIRIRFTVTVIGILTSFALLALLMTFLRATGSALGWGIQFQNPWFLTVMVFITFLFSLSLADVFTLSLPASMTSWLALAGGKGIVGSFLEGAFATLLATPCSAPFMGTAIAFALGAPLYELWGIFIMLGVGMSLPWIMVAIFPAIAHWLPKPGKWMLRVRMLLAILMLGSCLWLLTLLKVWIGSGWIWLLSTLTLCLFTVLVYFRSRFLIPIAISVILAFSVWFIFPLNSPFSSGEERAPGLHWLPLTEQNLQTALSQNKRVFIDITANWCISCKVNDQRVLNRADIQRKLNEPDVVLLRGDWSQPSATISTFLNRRQHYAIPFNEVYGPGSRSGTVLPPILSQDKVISALNEAKGIPQ